MAYEIELQPMDLSFRYQKSILKVPLKSIPRAVHFPC